MQIKDYLLVGSVLLISLLLAFLLWDSGSGR
jgi:hypothetical protein